MDFVYFILAFMIYLLPTLIAAHRSHGNMNSICILNLALGWTLLGWLIALIWCASDNTVKRG